MSLGTPLRLPRTHLASCELFQLRPGQVKSPGQNSLTEAYALARGPPVRPPYVEIQNHLCNTVQRSAGAFARTGASPLMPEYQGIMGTGPGTLAMPRLRQKRLFITLLDLQQRRLRCFQCRQAQPSPAQPPCRPALLHAILQLLATGVNCPALASPPHCPALGQGQAVERPEQR